MVLQNPDLHRCSNCGYLGQLVDGNLTFRTANAGEREGGMERWAGAAGVSPKTGDPTLFVRLLACYRRAWPLDYEMEGLEGPASRDKSKAVIYRERLCPQFRDLIPFWTDEQHLDAENAELLEKARQEWETAREADRRAFEERMQKRTDDVQKSLFKTSVIGLVVGVIAIGVSAYVTSHYANPTVQNTIVVPAGPTQAAPIINVIAPTPLQSVPGTATGQP